MENQSANQPKDIQQANLENENSGTSLAEDTAKNKEEANDTGGQGIGGTDIRGEDSFDKSNPHTSKSFDRDQEEIDLGLDDGDLDTDASHRDSELI